MVELVYLTSKFFDCDVIASLNIDCVLLMVPNPRSTGHYKGSEYPLNTVILMVMFYDGKRIQIRVSQGKRCMGQSSGSFQIWYFHLSFPVESWTELPLSAVMCDNIHRALITRDTPQALMYRALLELKHTDMVDCLTFVSCHSRSKADTT